MRAGFRSRRLPRSAVSQPLIASCATRSRSHDPALRASRGVAPHSVFADASGGARPMAFADAGTGEAFSAWHSTSTCPVDPAVVGLGEASSPLKRCAAWRRPSVCAASARDAPYDAAARALSASPVASGLGQAGSACAVPRGGSAVDAPRDGRRIHGTGSVSGDAWNRSVDLEFARLCLWFVLRCGMYRVMFLMGMPLCSATGRVARRQGVPRGQVGTGARGGRRWQGGECGRWKQRRCADKLTRC